MSDHPADIRGAEHDFAWMDAEEIPHGEIEANHMSSGFSQDAFGQASRARSIDNVDAVVGFDRDTICFQASIPRALDASLPIPLAFVFGDWVPSKLVSLPYDDLLRLVAALF